MRGAQILEAAGRALYGDRWQTPIARDLGTTYRTIRNWLAGQHAPPNDLRIRLEVLLRERGLAIEAVLELIDTTEDESRKQ
ncbi:hypothetical protein GCM10009095_23640 [Sphingomonas molluscorum]